MSAETDAELVEMVRQRGDTSAYGELIRRYQGHAYGLAYSILGDWAEAQDMAQEGFIRAYINLHTLDNPARFPAWLQRIVFSACISWLRAFRPELYRSMGEPDDADSLDTIPDSKTATPFEKVLDNEMSEVVMAAINDLPQKYRIPLTMFHLDGLSYRKVADFLEIPINTVRSLISRARKKLKPALQSYAQEVFPMVREVLSEHKLTEDFAQRTQAEAVRLKGDMETQNSFALVMQEAARLLGREASYDDVFAWSTSPFAPCLDPPEPSKGWWALCHDGGVFDIINSRLGLKVDFHSWTGRKCRSRHQTHQRKR